MSISVEINENDKLPSDKSTTSSTESKEVQIVEASVRKNKKSRAFSDRETLLLIAEWYKYPQLYDKQASEYHDRDKRILAKENIALYLNEALGFQEKDSKRITGKD